MNRIQNKIILIAIGLILSTISYSQEKGTFDSQAFEKKETKDAIKQAGPPDAGGGTGGNPIPINKGIGLLLAGSFIFFAHKINRALKDEQA